MARKPRHVAAKRPAGLEPAERGVDDLGPNRVVPDEGDVALVVALRRGLSGVVEKCPEPQTVAAGEIVAKRLVQERAHGLGALTRVPLEIAFDLEDLPENLDRVVVDIQMVVRVLSHAAQSFELRQDSARGTQRVQELNPAHGVIGGDQEAQLGEPPLPRRLACPR